ncbi:UDP-galactose 4-epimerase [Fluviicoccus keumensis]|uniref:UDP-glucose 4-epimerase n=1 Tax=Fluviicoccus keumensis TaxID=1435465 RepID=A0A4Q7YIT3_9GAMM|nr:UDP-glucose 4-epimerase GalE [Fluviicoccus keumensis]RZU37058.1 UDP-galactose 4-epimerase [Fluviicoccus keumensis]
MILLTGGAGYIGSHAAIEFVKAGYEVLALDNFSNSKPEAVRRTRELAGKDFPLIEGDIRDRALLDRVFAQYPISAVVHFAGLKAVGESVREPLHYFDNNVCGSVTLLQAMAAANVRCLVFSSSATVYGDPHTVPIREDFPLSATNPYGGSKLMIENILRDLIHAQPEWRIALLRYFNPAGAHPSGRIGEDPNGIPNNLMPYVAQVATGKLSRLSVFGSDYPTHDGTGVRDYIHVVDLVRGHVKALQYLESHPGLVTVNLGTGRGYSVLDMVKAFERASGKPVAYELVGRRPGDVAACYADPALAQQLFGWAAEFDQEAMCRDAWNWQRQNPAGYASA